MQTGIHKFSTTERVSFGTPAAEALVQELETEGVQRVLVTTTPPLKGTAFLESITSAIGDKLVGVFDEIAAHSPRESVVAGAAVARETKADVIVAVGGGSVIDASKVMLMSLWNDVTRIDELSALSSKAFIDQSIRPSGMDDATRLIAIPTTLAGAEYTWYAGITNLQSKTKETYNHAMMVPRAIILDPRATIGTPAELLLSTGIKAVDHAVERICSLNANAISDANAMHALRLLADALPRIAKDENDLEARSNCQLGAWLSIIGGASGVGIGASHAMGHVLGGTFGVPHGLTSCVTLPAVLKWNAVVNADRQKLVSEAMGAPDKPANVCVAELVAALGLPGRLAEVGVTREDYDKMADKTLQERNLVKNPRPVKTKADVFEILELAS